MDITAISDLHGEQPALPGGDLLIVAGDLTSNDSVEAHLSFIRWISALRYQKIVFIAGNHDKRLETGLIKEAYDLDDLPAERWADDIEYLEDSSTVYGGLHIYGSPWTPWFDGVPRHASAFMCADLTSRHDRPDLQQKFSLIPADDCDILITHAPPYGIMDKIVRTFFASDPHKGSRSLLEAVKRVKPWIHFFGHIHEEFGYVLKEDTLFCNCSFMDENYEPRGKIIRVTVEKEGNHRKATPEILSL